MGFEKRFKSDDVFRLISLLLAIFFTPRISSFILFFIFLISFLSLTFLRIWKPETKLNLKISLLESVLALVAFVITNNFFSPFFPYLLVAIFNLVQSSNPAISILFSLIVITLFNISALNNSVLKPLIYPINGFTLILIATAYFLRNAQLHAKEILEKAPEEESSELKLLDHLSNFHDAIRKAFTLSDVYIKTLDFLANFNISKFLVYSPSRETFTLVERKGEEISVEDATEKIDFEPRNPPDLVVLNSDSFMKLTRLTEIVFYVPELEAEESLLVGLRLGADLASHRISEVFLSESEKQLISRFSTLYETSQRISTTIGIKDALETAAKAVKEMTGMQKSVVLLASNPAEVEEAFFNPDKTVVKGRMDEHPEKIWQKGFFKAAVDCLSSLKPVIGSFGNFGITLLCIPISSRNKTYGIIAGITSLSKAEAKRDLKIMEIISSMLSLYFVNRELLSKQKDIAVSEERDRIAKEMHDSLIQSLFSVLLLIEASINEIKQSPESGSKILLEIKQRLQEIIKETRQMILELYPHALTDAGFRSALDRILSNFSGIKFNIDIDIPEHINLNLSLENALLRIVQEATSNAVRHGKADTVSISIQINENLLLLTVEDNGTGFDPEKINYFINSKEHFGLSSIFERTESLGGKAEIETQPGKGTKLSVKIPI